MNNQPVPTSMRRVISTWWPLAISWMLMSAEPPMLSAVVARLAHPEIHLAAYGSVAFPLIGILQAPILTLLSLSTAMSKDWDSFRKGRKIMYFMGGGLTIMYAIITFTPLYYVVVRDIIGAPAEIIEPARLGMYVGLPWAFAVAYRRFHQGVLIRFEHTRVMTIGTILRFASDALVLTMAFLLKSIPGTVVAAAMMVVGVITEAVYVGIRVRVVLNNEVKPAPSLHGQILLRDMVKFFIPLALTPLISQLIRPIGSAALARMANPLQTFAIWPVISGFAALIITPGSAYNEVVIAMLDRPRAKRSLRIFMGVLMAAQFLVMLLLAFSPLAYLWFLRVSGLSPELARAASQAFVILIPMSLISPLNSWYTGAILHGRRSRAVTEGMVVYLGVYVTGLVVGTHLANVNGVLIAVTASVVASVLQTVWLGVRGRSIIAKIDAELPPAAVE